MLLSIPHGRVVVELLVKPKTQLAAAEVASKRINSVKTKFKTREKGHTKNSRSMKRTFPQNRSVRKQVNSIKKLAPAGGNIANV